MDLCCKSSTVSTKLFGEKLAMWLLTFALCLTCPFLNLEVVQHQRSDLVLGDAHHPIFRIRISTKGYRKPANGTTRYYE